MLPELLALRRPPFLSDGKDPELAYACLRTYNDYLLDEWCATDPERLFGAVILPLNDIDLAVAELRRVHRQRGQGHRLLRKPDRLGLPSVHTSHWDPLLAVANEAGLPVCMHIGSSSRLITTSAGRARHRPHRPARLELHVRRRRLAA